MIGTFLHTKCMEDFGRLVTKLMREHASVEEHLNSVIPHTQTDLKLISDE
jgi:hypothetical protein